MKEITLKDIESLCRQIEIPEIQHLGNNLYKIPGGIICEEKFLEHFYAEMLKSIKEYNTDKSAEHPTNEGEDIVRYSFEKRRVQDKEPACNN